MSILRARQRRSATDRRASTEVGGRCQRCSWQTGGIRKGVSFTPTRLTTLTPEKRASDEGGRGHNGTGRVDQLGATKAADVHPDRP
jgi:hypothetical protein